jgi:hypothetical protein
MSYTHCQIRKGMINPVIYSFIGIFIIRRCDMHHAISSNKNIRMHTTFLLLKVLRTKRDTKKMKSISPCIKRRVHNHWLNVRISGQNHRRNGNKKVSQPLITESYTMIWQRKQRSRDLSDEAETSENHSHISNKVQFTHVKAWIHCTKVTAKELYQFQI